MAAAVRAHYAILAEAIGRYGGLRPVEQGEGDSVVAVFTCSSDALAAALRAQRVLLADGGPAGLPVRVRMALHTAEAQLRDRGNLLRRGVEPCRTYSRSRRRRSDAALRATRDLVHSRLPRDATLADLG